MRGTSATLTFAQYLREFDAARLLPDVRSMAASCVLDVLGSAAAGHAAPAVAGLREVARSAFGTGDAAVWFSGARLTAPGAVFCNSAAASALDLDDGNRSARGHPGAAVIPAALAAAAEVEASADDFVAAVVGGL